MSDNKYMNCRHWPTTLSYDYAIVISDRHGAYHSTVYQARTYENAVKRGKEETRYGANSSKYDVLHKDAYEAGLRALRNNNFKEADFTAYSQEVKKEMQDKPVWLVWDLTNATFQGAHTSDENALNAAQNLARKHPTNKYLVCAPSKVAYQPINIQVEDAFPQLPAPQVV